MSTNPVYRLRKTKTQTKRKKAHTKVFSKIRQLSPTDPKKDRSKFKGTKLSSLKPKKRYA